MPRPIIAVLSSALYVLAFPKFNFSYIAWIALVPLAYVAVEQKPRQAFWLGWLAGTLAYAGLLYWVVVTFLAAKQSIFLAIFCVLLLSAYLGLYWGGWTVFLSLSSTRWGLSPFLAAAAWTALEYVRTHLFSGFPWTLLGDSQWQQLPLIQAASLTGVYGISFLVILVNTTIVSSLCDYSSTRTRLQRVFTLVLVVISLFFGMKRLRAYAVEPQGKTQRVALLQGNIDQYQKWDKRYVEDIERIYEQLNDQAAKIDPALIIWPETSVPGYLLQDPPLRAWLIRVIQRTGAHHLVGAPSMSQENAAYNSLFSLNPQGHIMGQYDKQHLVPFGEVVPWARVLGRWIRVLNDLGGFTAGWRSPIVATGIGEAGLNICYEAIFPNLVRQAVLQGARTIVNVTNDGWYMRTAAPHQHFIPNVFRAVENNRWVLRANNTGITSVIDPVGHIQSASPIFVPTVITGTIVQRSGLTFYTRYGDVFAGGCLLFCILLCLRAILRR